LEELKEDDGLDKVIAFLDSKLLKDDLADSWDKFSEFEEYQRENGQSISDFLLQFEQKNRIVQKGMKLPNEILAFKLLKQAKLMQEEHLLVLTGLNYTDKATLFEQAKSP